MIIQCDKCSTKFRLDDSRITGNGVKVRCTKCQNVFIVAPPPPVEEVQVEEDAVKGDERPKRSLDDVNLKFDFARMKSKSEPKEASAPPPVSSAEEAKPPADDFKQDEPAASDQPKAPASFNEIDFSFGEDRSRAEGAKDLSLKGGSSGGSAEDEEKGFGFDVSGADEKKEAEKNPFSDLTFDDRKNEDEDKHKQDEWKLREEPAGDDHSAEKNFKASEEKVIPFNLGRKDGAYASAGKETEEAETREIPSKAEEFKDVFAHYIKDEGISASEGEEIIRAAGQPKKASRIGMIAAILIFMAGAAVFYFTGAADMLTGKLMPAPRAVVNKTVEIESINGFFAENKNFGKLFVIEAKIKNTSEVPQEVKAVTGIIYNSSGDKIAVRSVSPGRVVSGDDIKNLSREDLLKPFKDPSGGSIPPKGTIPIMVFFTDIPQGMAEYGLDIVR